MTVLEATNLLLAYFARNEYFQLGKDFSKVVLISDTNADKAAIIIALEELEKQRFVVRKKLEGKDEEEYWILFKPLAFQTQEIQVNFLTAIQIANTINKFINKEDDKVSPMNISENDLLSLIMIANKQD